MLSRVDGETLSSVSIQTAENNEAIDVRLSKMSMAATHLSVDSGRR